MDVMTIAAMVLVGVGFAGVVVGLLTRLYTPEEELADILGLSVDAELDTGVEGEEPRQSAVAENLAGLAGKAVAQLDARGSLARTLELARIPLRPGELVVLVVSAGIVLGSLLAALSGRWILGVMAFATVPLLARTALRWAVQRRRRRFAEQFPDALTLIASSLSAGHTFLRAISLMCEESPPPLREEFARVVSETQLGDPVVDALDRMSQRLQMRDVEWVVQAIRIQQQVGGGLADLLHTLADFIRARDDVRREVQVLTAEGRMSAYVLGALPIVLLLAISLINPGYMDPLFQGWGPVVLGAAGGWGAIGFGVILKMVRVDM